MVWPVRTFVPPRFADQRAQHAAVIDEALWLPWPSSGPGRCSVDDGEGLDAEDGVAEMSRRRMRPLGRRENPRSPALRRSRIGGSKVERRGEELEPDRSRRSGEHRVRVTRHFAAGSRRSFPIMGGARVIANPDVTRRAAAHACGPRTPGPEPWYATNGAQ